MLKQMSSQISQGEKDDSGGNKMDESEYIKAGHMQIGLILQIVLTSLFAELLIPEQENSEGKKISIKESFSGKQ